MQLNPSCETDYHLNLNLELHTQVLLGQCPKISPNVCPSNLPGSCFKSETFPRNGLKRKTVHRLGFKSKTSPPGGDFKAKLSPLQVLKVNVKTLEGWYKK